MAAAIRCTIPSCTCECFAPGKSALRVCDTCKHGWVAHALDKLGFNQIMQLGMSVEVVQPNIVFDIASLMLYGTHATPVRLKILLDRLFSVLQHDEVIKVLHGFGWSYEDYARGYILQDTSGRVLDKWSVVTREEEDVIIQQFLRFGETRAIAQELILQGVKDKSTELPQTTTPKTESEIKKFIERNQMNIQSYMRSLDAQRLIGNKILYPNAGSAAAAFMGLPHLGTFSSSVAASSQKSETQTSSRVATSPLNQPFDLRQDNEHASPSSSPASSVSENLRGYSSTSQSPQSSIAGSASTLPLVKVPQLPINIASSFAQSILKTPFSLRALTSEFSLNSPTSESQDTAINYSTKGSVEYTADDHKTKISRKLPVSLKRSWPSPSGSFGHAFISPSGKKRVLCTVCNKTFCDKGALKIHYSAVHLKEMHKCSVEGCNMMFSSRRSRNRHSANPNPKLHQPQKRKIPDGVTIVEDGKISSPDPRDILEIPASTMPIEIPMNPLASAKSLYQPIRLTESLHDVTASSFYSTGGEGIQKDKSEQCLPKKFKLDTETINEADDDEDMKSKSDSNSSQEKTEKVPQSQMSQQRSTSKRKRLVPTRCAQSNEDVFIMSDDNSDHEQFDDEFNESFEKDVYAKGGCESGVGCFTPSGGSPGVSKGDDSDDMDQSSNESPGDKEDISFLLPDHAKRDTPSFGLTAFHEIQEKALKQMYGINSGTSLTYNRPGFPLFSLPQHISNYIEDTNDSAVNRTSDQDDNISGSSESLEPIHTNGQKSPQSPSQLDDIELSGLDIPIDQENPKKCLACGKLFQNSFSVKTHYQSVHLKLMHTCTVDGCNAAFPSKRSRNRHSGNLNLHRKLLSTSSQIEGNGDRSESLRSEFLSRIYDSPLLPKEKHNGDKYSGTHDTSHVTCFPGTAVTISSGSTLSIDNSYANADNNGDCSSPEASENSVTCHICNGRFRDNLVLKEHFEKVHPKDMYKCTVDGCDKVFSTRKSRNRHSQNDNLHKHLMPVSRPQPVL